MEGAPSPGLVLSHFDMHIKPAPNNTYEVSFRITTTAGIEASAHSVLFDNPPDISISCGGTVRFAANGVPNSAEELTAVLRGGGLHLGGKGWGKGNNRVGPC